MVWCAIVILSMAAVAWLGNRMITRGNRGIGPASAFGAMSEIFHPAQHRADQERREQQERRAEEGTPDRGP